MFYIIHNNINWFIIPVDSTKDNIDIAAWLDSSTISKNDWIIFKMKIIGKLVYGFKNLNDAMHFKLSWG